MNADLEVQKALRGRLIASAAVTALVPAANILDTNQRPAPRPAIILGDSQSIDEGTSLRRSHWRIYHTLHIWVREPSLQRAKTIAAAIHGELRTARLLLGGGLHCGDLHVTGQRFLRDPDGEHSHGVVTVEALVSEVTP